jgi:hypothetical protein
VLGARVGLIFLRYADMRFTAIGGVFATIGPSDRSMKDM